MKPSERAPTKCNLVVKLFQYLSENISTMLRELPLNVIYCETSLIFGHEHGHSAALWIK